jgi:DNA (cytosine-5)-methyltransferase 1
MTPNRVTHAPRLLDLFCCAGGAARGYQMAGFHVTGIDNRKQPRYAGDVFIQADALEYIAEHGHEFDAIHASPPCQAYSEATPMAYKHTHPDLIAPIRKLLIATGKTYVIENVKGARSEMESPFTLCGTMFDLRVYRHRLFESNVFFLTPPHIPHRDDLAGNGRGLSSKGFITVTGNGGYGMKGGDAYARMAMGIDWMTRIELVEAIPPAYTEWIGQQLMAVLA